MLRFFSHPYILATVAAVCVIVIGIVVVVTRSGVGPQTIAPRTWDTIGANLMDPLGAAALPPGAPQDNLYTQVHSGAPFQYINIAPPPPGPAAASDDFDLDSFLASLVRPGSSVSTPSVKTDTGIDAYSFIPAGLLSTTSPLKERTELQGTIYEYGNDAGSYIQSYDQAFQGSAQILKDQFEDREDATKNGRLAALAGGMIEVGTSLQNSDIVPPAFKSANAALAKSYITMGTKLKAVGAAHADQAVIDAITAYNGSVEEFTKNYVTLATLFSAYNVTFKTDDPGSVFMFTNSPSF